MDYELKTVGSNEVYQYMSDISFPYHYPVDFSLWEKSYLEDRDGEGRVLFSGLEALGAYADARLIGYIQFGRTALGFDDSGDISDRVSYPVIRNFYFSKGYEEAGNALLKAAAAVLSGGGERIYAFFHYFGMSCYARHGKLFEDFGYIQELLIRNGFIIEHENVFYSSEPRETAETGIRLVWQEQTAGGCESCDFIMAGNTVGGCEIHFLEQKDTAYLRWIYIKDGLCGKGIGSACMRVLSSQLFQRGIRVFDTDTALNNLIAQRYYEKNGFTRRGITRSYYREFKG